MFPAKLSNLFYVEHNNDFYTDFRYVSLVLRKIGILPVHLRLRGPSSADEKKKKKAARRWSVSYSYSGPLGVTYLHAAALVATMAWNYATDDGRLEGADVVYMILVLIRNVNLTFRIFDHVLESHDYVRMIDCMEACDRVMGVGAGAGDRRPLPSRCTVKKLRNAVWNVLLAAVGFETVWYVLVQRLLGLPAAIQCNARLLCYSKTALLLPFMKLVQLYFLYLSYEIRVRTRLLAESLRGHCGGPPASAPFRHRFDSPSIEPDLLETYRLFHCRLLCAARQVSTCLGLHVFGEFITVLCNSCILSMYLDFSSGFFIFRILSALLYMVFLIKTNEFIKKSNRVMLEILFRFSKSNMDVDLQYQVDHFIHQISVNPIVLDAAGFFKIDKTLIPAYLNNIVSYIIIAIQIQMSSVTKTQV